jgi:arginine deiminase
MNPVAPAFQNVYCTRKGSLAKIDFLDLLKEKGIEVVEVSDEERKRLACSFVPLQSGVIIHSDQALNRETRRRLERKGVEFIFFHPDALLAGGGSLRCLTLQLYRRG